MMPYMGEPKAWNELIASLPLPHLLQTWEWAQVKSKYGWKAMPFVWSTGPGDGRVGAAAMVLKRSLPIGGFAARLNILYIPKGPNLDWNDASLRQQVFDDLEAFARRQGAIFVKMDPDVILGTGIPNTAEAVEQDSGQQVKSELEQRGWHFSQDQIQFRNTVLINLQPTETELLGRMKQKTRYNIRLAQKKGVSVRRGTPADLPLLYRLYAETSVRDGFLIRGRITTKPSGKYSTWSSVRKTRSRSPYPNPSSPK